MESFKHKKIFCLQSLIIAYIEIKYQVTKVRYTAKPITSMVVAITGPDATAGSIFIFFSINGVQVPIIVAIVMFKAIARPTIKPN